ncbi:hypothetical protein SAMN05421833_12985 [Microbispora rosea]|uniref:Uncharacterized protein n=1 Tax=Microbispora rosea TaxID=58117 RepID=A0A1N7GIZ5_9ACTN|nr:hypothetical protein [Microbispora rosea]GIH51678.1 hypothetical protein Mro03_68570 [Microbispora rosea subsp. rosea]SIS12557.1 hypothetical protein SAMN05421833_12985 [Microbispora rosea]
MLNTASTAEGRAILQRAAEDALRLERRGAWACLAHVAREATGAPLPPGPVRPVHIPDRAWDYITTAGCKPLNARTPLQRFAGEGAETQLRRSAFDT